MLRLFFCNPNCKFRVSRFTPFSQLSILYCVSRKILRLYIYNPNTFRLKASSAPVPAKSSNAFSVT
jgi:hypothetical protein